ncbi:rhomboid family intramembrane serine protease [Candidatus Falkowbacteria bacterium]|jgi:rhomboid protease GluP|nr:rhomboid family intramembrane serine protease [Candidatus Falkowbacteria bacterium]MBT5502796.1 rhomboid family intramembrane serine protease [Candidatus Falkowbacteria bacterium]MBT6573434.1 rhomboid family intramembrane serine protease [Candidatus Falkowbacteria bacterium]MBT7501181.1 rhomboid family intramembrane serine protease [Candidatus Falkowbacteria bacterium]
MEKTAIVTKIRSRISYNAPVIYTYAIICMLILALTSIFSGLHVFVESPAEFATDKVLFWLGLFTHIFGHSGWEHYAANFMLIVLIGPLLEEKYGSWWLILMIITTSIITALFNTLLFDHTVRGASGITFMFIILASYAGAKVNKIPFGFLLAILIFLSVEVVGMFNDDNIAHFSHLVGGGCGAFMASLYIKLQHKIQARRLAKQPSDEFATEPSPAPINPATGEIDLEKLLSD